MNRPTDRPALSEYLIAVRNGIGLGLAALVVVIPVMRATAPEPAQPPSTSRAAVQAEKAARPTTPRAIAMATPQPPAIRRGFSKPPAVKPANKPPEPLRLASFGDEEPSVDARHVAHWAVHSRDHQQKAFVVVDKKDARVYVFDPKGELVAASPALLGAAAGDHTVPGIGEKPLSQVLPEEKTTPAGRFIAERGRNLQGEDIVWVDYDAAVSMHRVRPLVAAERRLERLDSPTPQDNRISFGCINLPVAFYEKVLSPTVQAHGAVVYVLPEVQDVKQVFGSYDVLAGEQLASR